MHPRRFPPLDSLRTHLRALALTAAFACLSAASAMAADGIPVCVSPFDQFAPVSVPDGAGGMYVAWLDQRLGYNTDVYVQRVSGALQRPTGWPDNGLAMTFVTCTKTEIALTADSNGVVGVWSDNRCNAGSGFDVYVERVTPKGVRAAGWPANGRLVFGGGGDQLHTAIAPDGAGGVFVAWTDLGVARKLSAQHVLANGTLDPAWPVDGIALTSTLSDSTAASLVSDGAGGVFVAWQDVRTDAGDVWMQRLKGDGTPAAGWSAGGAAYVIATGNQYAPRLVSDGAGGAIAVWYDRRAGVTQLRALRVSANGALASGWAADGNALAATAAEQGRYSALADSAGGVYVAWQDARSGTAAVYAQHLGATGTAIAPWPSGGVAVAPNAAAQTGPVLARDGAGGLYVSWHDARDLGVSGADLYATRLDASGAHVSGWVAAGTLVCNATAEQRDVRLAQGSAGNALVAWTDARATATRGTDIAVAALSPTGSSTTAARAIAATHHDGQTFLTWQSPPGTNWKYRVYRSTTPIATTADLAAATLVGTLGDSSAYERHVSQCMGIPYGYRTDSLGTDLDPAQGLYVHTVSGNGSAWYAVTAQNSVFGENTAVTPGGNALAAPVTEWLARPRPVYQRGVLVNNHFADLYTLFVSDHDTPLMPAMGNRAGLAYDCGVVRPPAIPFSQSTLLLPLHYRGGSVLEGIYGTGYPGEWVLGLDDWLPNNQNTFWYGYGENYDITLASTAVPLTTGKVVDYTLRRVNFSLDWMLRTFPIDSNRVYAFGYSMGGAGSVLMGTHLGNRFAATMSVVGKADYSFDADPDTNAWYNPNGNLRKLANSMWGSLASNLPATEGGSIWEQLDAGWLAEHAPQREFAPMWLYAGKLDNTMSWGENAPFWDIMQSTGRGSALYWEMRHHNETYQALWAPTQDPRRLYRYQLDQSYPAPSRCSFDGDPGNGIATDGDSTGTINGHFEWDPQGVDSTTHWARGMNLKSLTTMLGQRVPPDSCTMDLTIRRVQRFRTLPGETVEFTVRDISGGMRVAQQGSAVADASGLLTLTAVKVFRNGSLLDIRRPEFLAVAPGATAPHAGIALSRHPARGVVQMSVTWPGAGAARAALYDVSGRQVRLLWSGVAKAGTQALSLDTATLPPGLYLVGAEAGGRRVSKRMVVLR